MDIEMNIKRGRDEYKRTLEKKSRVAREIADTAADKMCKVSWNRNIKDQERLNSFVFDKLKK